MKRAAEETSNTSLADTLLEALGMEAPRQEDPKDSIARVLSDSIAKATSSRPAVHADLAAFVRFLAGKLSRDSSLVEQLKRLRVADLYFAFAAMQRDEAALRELQQIVSPQGLKIVRRNSSLARFVNEVREDLCSRLVCGDAKKPALLASYAGKGGLLNWLRAVLLRRAINKSDGARELPHGLRVPVELDAALIDPDIELIRRRHRGDLDAALREAMTQLSARDRNLLRLYFVASASVESIGRSYGVDKSTASRWLSAIRQGLRDTTLHLLAERLHISIREASSLMRGLKSELEASVTGLLA